MSIYFQMHVHKAICEYVCMKYLNSGISIFTYMYVYFQKTALALKISAN